MRKMFLSVTEIIIAGFDALFRRAILKMSSQFSTSNAIIGSTARISLLTRLRVLGAKGLRYTKIRAAILSGADRLNHDVAIVIARATCIRGSMIGDVCSAAIRAGEEAVVPCTKVTICLRQTASVTLFPSGCRRRVA